MFEIMSAERPAGSTTNHVSIDSASGIISLDFTTWSFADYHEVTSITFSVHQGSYDDSALTEEHSFTVTEVDCSIRYDSVPNQVTAIAIYVQTATGQETITFAYNPLTPVECQDAAWSNFSGFDSTLSP